MEEKQSKIPGSPEVAEPNESNIVRIGDKAAKLPKPGTTPKVEA